jgi:hypothetical protein
MWMWFSANEELKAFTDHQILRSAPRPEQTPIQKDETSGLALVSAFPQSHPECSRLHVLLAVCVP